MPPYTVLSSMPVRRICGWLTTTSPVRSSRTPARIAGWNTRTAPATESAPAAKPSEGSIPVRDAAHPRTTGPLTATAALPSSTRRCESEGPGRTTSRRGTGSSRFPSPTRWRPCGTHRGTSENTDSSWLTTSAARSPRTNTSTTRITTEAITGSRTCRLWRRPITAPCTCGNDGSEVRSSSRQRSPIASEVTRTTTRTPTSVRLAHGSAGRASGSAAGWSHHRSLTESGPVPDAAKTRSPLDYGAGLSVTTVGVSPSPNMERDL